MRQVLNDIIKHFVGLGSLTEIKGSSDSSRTTFSAMDADRTIIVNAETKAPVEELVGDFGMSRLGILNGYLNFSSYKSDNATISVKNKTRAGASTPDEIVFSDGDGQKSIYRFMDTSLIPAVSKFVGVEWDVVIDPSDSKIAEFSQMASILSESEKFFGVKVEDGILYFTIGDEDDGSTDSAVIKIGEVDGAINSDLHWPISQVLSTLKIGRGENVEMSFSSRGALQISLSNSLVDYTVILPAHRRQ